MGRGPRTYLVAACLALVAPAAAHAQSVAPDAGCRPAPSSPASVARLDCAGRCGTGGAVRPGSLLRVRGRDMSRADEVVFLGAAGRRGRRHGDDDRRGAGPRSTCASRSAPPPGPVAVVDRDRALSGPSPAALALEPTPPAAEPSVEAAVNAPRAYVDSAQPAVLDLRRARAGAGAGHDRARARARRCRPAPLGRAAGRAGGDPAARLGRARRGPRPARRALRVPGHRRRARRRGRELRARRASASRSSASSPSAAAPRRSAAGAATRARTCSPAAGRRSSRPAAAPSSSPAITAAPATTS